MENAIRLVNPTGSIGMIGVYIAPDPSAKKRKLQNVDGSSGLF